MASYGILATVAEAPERLCARPGCGETFQPKRFWQKYHSRYCQRADARARHTHRTLALACPHCQQPLNVRLELVGTRDG